ELLRELNGDGLPPAVRDEDPARAGRVNQLARDTELPRDAVEQGLDEIEAARRAERADKVAEGAPSVRRRLTDPTTAAITQDDVEGLAYLEQVGRAWDRSVASTRRGLTVQTLTYVMDRQRELGALDAKIAAGEHISLDEDPAGYASMSDLERRAYRLDLARNLRDGLREYGARTAELQMAGPPTADIQRAADADTIGEFFDAITGAPTDSLIQLLKQTLGNTGLMLAESGASLVGSVAGAAVGGLV